MSQTRILIVAILTVLMTFIYASKAQDRPEGGPSVMGSRPERPKGPEGPAPWMREYAEELRVRAREAQEFADRLRQDADRFEQMARQAGGPEMGPGPMEPMRRELAEIREAIGRAEREGRPDEAAELRKNAERLMDEMRTRQRESRQGGGPGMRPGPMEPMRGELAEIKEAIGRAEREGRPDEAAELRRNAERLMGEMRTRQPRPQGDEQRFAEAKERIERLKNQLREAEESGRPEQAGELREQIQGIEMKMRRGMESRDTGAQLESMRGKVAELRKQAQRAKQEGRFEEAQAQWEKANDIERQIGEVEQQKGRPQKEPEVRPRAVQNPDAEKGPRERGGEPSPEVEQLREKVARLQEEVARLSQQLRDKEPR